jgi:drug/metabolite transporter (DMT)-like permease
MSRSLALLKASITRRPDILVCLAYVLAAFCWGHSGVIVRFSMKGYTPYATLAMRLTLATIGAFLLQRTFAKEERATRSQLVWLLLAGALGGLGYACVYFSNRFVTSAVSTSVLAIESGIATFVAFFALRRKDTTFLNVIGGAVGCLGVWAIYSERAVFSQEQAWAILILAAGALFFALGAFPMEAAKKVHPYARLAPLFAPMTVIAWLVTLVEASTTNGQIRFPWETIPLLAVIHLGLICTLLPFIAFYKVVSEWGPARALTMTLVIPPIAFLSDQIGEPEPMRLGLIGLGGVVLVLVGVFLSFQTRRRQATG